MIRFFALACLLAAAAAQRTYYCTPGGISNITDRDFYFVTRSPSDSSYSPGTICELNLNPGTGIMLDIHSFDVYIAVLKVTDGSKTLFKGSTLEHYQSSIVSTSGFMKITFTSSRDQISFPGVTMRLRLFDYNRCPPGWTYLYGNCFGTSNTTGRLRYLDAQKACNNMKANLMHVPSNYSGTIGSFMRMLPTHLREYYTWIGLTDRTSYGQYIPYWLNGARQLGKTEISCGSSSRYSNCYSRERCGTFDHRSTQYAIYMLSCTSYKKYACSMPPGGSAVFYTVPNPRIIVYTSGYTVYYSLIWGILVGSLFILCLIIGGIYAGARSNIHRTAGPSSVVVSTGRVTVAPKTMAFSAKNNMQTSTPPPLANNMVVDDHGCNIGGCSK